LAGFHPILIGRFSPDPRRYEAAVLAMAEFRRHGFAETTFGPATKLTVKIHEPEMSHMVSVSRLRTWLDGVGKSPGEHALKSKLRQLV
jgi:hypothetical protein